MCVHDYRTVVLAGSQMMRGVSSYCVNAVIIDKIINNNNSYRYRGYFILALI